MSLGVLNNISAIYAQNNLSATQNNLSKTLQQLSSGSRINSGADDAAGLAVADGLAANETALAQSSRNASDATGLLQTADGALSQVTSLLNRAVTLATQAANGTLSSAQVSSANQEYQNILTQVNNIGTTTNFNGTSVFSGTARNFFVSDGTTTGSATYSDTVGVLSTTSVGTSAKAASSAAVSLTAPSASSASAASTTTLTLGATTDTVSGTLALAVGTGSSHSITIASGTTLSGLATQINGDSTYQGAGITAAYDSTTGALTISGPVAASSDLDATGTSLSDASPASGSGVGVDFTASGVSTLTAGSAKDVLTALTSAIGDVAFQRGTIGANINQLSSAQSVASNEQTNLTAAEDNIRATDYGQAASNLSKYQVLSQTGISALAQANSVQQEVTKLLQ
jgi:flagellin